MCMQNARGIWKQFACVSDLVQSTVAGRVTLCNLVVFSGLHFVVQLLLIQQSRNPNIIIIHPKDALTIISVIILSTHKYNRRHRAAHVESQIVPLFPQSLTSTVVGSGLNTACRRYEKCIVLGQYKCQNSVNEGSVIMVIAWFMWPWDDVMVNSVEATVDRFADDGEVAGKCPTVYE